MKYETPEMLVYTFEDEDIITVSTLTDGGTGSGESGDFEDIFKPVQ